MARRRPLTWRQGPAPPPPRNEVFSTWSGLSSCPHAFLFLEHLLMLQTIRRPWHSVETLLPDRLAVNGAQAESPVINPLKRRADKHEDGGIGLRQGEVLVFDLVGMGKVAGSGLVRTRIAGDGDLSGETLGERPLNSQQSLPVLLDVHGCSPIGSVLEAP